MCQVMADDPGGTGAHVAAPAFQTRAVLYSGKRLAGSDEPEDESLLMGGFDGHVNCCEKEKKRVFSCCTLDKNSQGCSKGPHVFYEKEYADLHSRFPFIQFLDSEEGVDAVALDCEMIYTTAGMRLAHVSVIDILGNVILDEQVRLEENVRVM